MERMFDVAAALASAVVEGTTAYLADVGTDVGPPTWEGYTMGVLCARGEGRVSRETVVWPEELTLQEIADACASASATLNRRVTASIVGRQLHFVIEK